ncbi:MAG: VanZ family protein [Halioglobus sp.]
MRAVFENICRAETLRFTLAIFFVSTILLASALRSFGYFVQDMYWLQEWLGGDKMSHCLMGFGLMLSAILIVVPRSLLSGLKTLSSVVAILLLEEFSQLIIKTREFDIADLMVSILGASIAIIIFLVLMLLCFSAPAPHEQSKLFE